MFRTDPGGPSAYTVTFPDQTLDERRTRRALREHVQRLQLILPVISVSVMALRQQRAELDEDIASVLHRHASDPLDAEIEKVEALLASLNPNREREVAI